MTVKKNKILVINTGSSSIKFQLFNCDNNFSVIAKGLVERINIHDSQIVTEIANGSNFAEHIVKKEIADHKTGANLIIEQLFSLKAILDFSELMGIGHRIVHGGENFTESIIIDENVISDIKACSALAPLHNPAALKGYYAFENLLPNLPHVAAFDTTFHTSLSEEKFLYSVPYEWYKKYEVRRYGFHGISYRFILKKLSELLQIGENKINAIVCHLGNGASICAIKNGKSYNTSMGLTPLDGLIMGTRSGIIDPSIPSYLCEITKSEKAPLDIFDITNQLNKNSGLLGISGVSSDLRDIMKTNSDLKHPQNKMAGLALKMFVQRIASYIITYANELAMDVDALVFTAGIGENSAVIREMVIKEIKIINLRINEVKNNEKYNSYLKISEESSQFAIYKIRTNEEIMICKDTFSLIK